MSKPLIVGCGYMAEGKLLWLILWPPRYVLFLATVAHLAPTLAMLVPYHHGTAGAGLLCEEGGAGLLCE